MHTQENTHVPVFSSLVTEVGKNWISIQNNVFSSLSLKETANFLWVMPMSPLIGHRHCDLALKIILPLKEFMH